MLEQRKKTYSDIVAKMLDSVTATVTVPDGTKELPMGTILRTTDGGLTFETRPEPHIEDVAYLVDDEVFSNGNTWKSIEDNNDTTPTTDNGKWEDLGIWDANGVLGEYLRKTESTHVITMGSVLKRNLPNFDETLRVQLFKNKINLV